MPIQEGEKERGRERGREREREREKQKQNDIRAWWRMPAEQRHRRWMRQAVDPDETGI